MQRIAAPMIGGLFTSFLMELLVYPAIYLLWRRRSLARESREVPPGEPLRSPAVGYTLAVVALLGFALGGWFFWPRTEAQPLYPKYEAARLALVAEDATSASKRGKELSELAKASGQETVAALAETLASAGDLESARHAFAELSDAMIAYREEAKEEPKPVVAYCSMAKHSWLQPKGAISNPYLGPSMTTCGEITTN